MFCDLSTAKTIRLRRCTSLPKHHFGIKVKYQHEGVFSRVTRLRSDEVCTCTGASKRGRLCLQTLTVFHQEICVSVGDNLVIIGSVIQSTYFFLPIWTPRSFKLAIITSHVVVALHFSILWGSFAAAKGIETKTEEGGREEGVEVETQPTDAFLPSDSISFKTSPNKWLFGINLVKRFLFPNDWIASSLICLWMRATFLFTLYLTQQELMELLWWWCMGDCVRRQMGKCNYECFRASGRKEKNCHKGEFKKQRQHHSSCETIVRKN